MLTIIKENEEHEYDKGQDNWNPCYDKETIVRSVNLREFDSKFFDLSAKCLCVNPSVFINARIDLIVHCE